MVGPRKFGDIRIDVLKASNFEGSINDPNIHEILGMKKKNEPFLLIFQDKMGNTTALSLLKDKKSTVFTLKSLNAQGGWVQAVYIGANEAGKRVFLTDIDFDGRFDVKHVHVFDDTGKKIFSKYIYIDQIWQQVDRCNFREAKLGHITYVFDPNSGWQIER